MRTKIEAARLRGFDQNSVNHPGILLMAHSAQFFTLDEVNPCCRPAPDNADRYTDFGRCWRVKSLQNCTMSTCRKKLSGRLWLKPVSGSPANNVRRKFSSHVIV